jgi:serine O-acetyltransferase
MGKTSKIVTWINFYLYGVEISSDCPIGPYFYMPHAEGAVIGAARIGSYAVIYHQVTIGATQVQFEHMFRPIIGDRVLISSGSKVVGNIEIGDDCKIGANCLVLSSMESGSLAISLEAKYTKRRDV